MFIKLVPTMGPFQDKIVSQKGNTVVLFSDNLEIGLLNFEADKNWHICGHQSVEAASGLEIKEASFYYRGSGYIKESEITYGCLNNNTSMYIWDRLYDEIGAKPLSLEEESEYLFRLLTKITPVAMFHTDPMGALIYVNEKWEEITGLDKQESFGHRWLTFVHKDDRNNIIKTFKKAIEKPLFITLEFRIILPDGSFKWLRLDSAVETNKHGEIDGYVGMVIDITSKQEYTNELERQVQLHTAELAAVYRQLNELTN